MGFSLELQQNSMFTNLIDWVIILKSEKQSSACTARYTRIQTSSVQFMTMKSMEPCVQPWLEATPR